MRENERGKLLGYCKVMEDSRNEYHWTGIQETMKPIYEST